MVAYIRGYFIFTGRPGGPSDGAGGGPRRFRKVIQFSYYRNGQPTTLWQSLLLLLLETRGWGSQFLKQQSRKYFRLCCFSLQIIKKYPCESFSSVCTPKAAHPVRPVRVRPVRVRSFLSSNQAIFDLDPIQLFEHSGSRNPQEKGGGNGMNQIKREPCGIIGQKHFPSRV